MTEHISTEEAERIAAWLRMPCSCGCNALVRQEAADALRALAAERDALATENERLRDELRAIAEGRWNRGRASDVSFREFARDALGENQP